MVLIVEDDKNTRLILQTILNDHGLQSEVADSVISGIAKLIELKPSLLIIDLMLLDGFAGPIIKECRANFPDTKIIVITALHNTQIEQALKGLYVHHLVQKPFDIERLEKLF